jgi:hypothetical protein
VISYEEFILSFAGMKNIPFVIIFLLILGCKSKKTPIHFAIKSSKPSISNVKKNLKDHKIQIKLTVINKDGNIDYEYNVDNEEYFYPASTVKLPIALLAIEKVNESKFITLDTPFRVENESEKYTLRDEIFKMFVISDNKSFNRIFEFLGQDYINGKLNALGFKNTTIFHRLSVVDSDNLKTKKVYFYIEEDSISYQTFNREIDANQINGLKKGKKFFNNKNELVKKPMDFSKKNRISINDLHEMTTQVFLPENYIDKKSFQLNNKQREFIWEAMSASPSKLGLNKEKYPDNFVKFFIRGDEKKKDSTINNLKIYNKVGTGYGQLTETAYMETENDRFILTATMYVNDNNIINDDIYEYETIGIPFFASLGKEILSLIEN